MKFKEILDKLKIKYNVVVIDEQTLTEKYNTHLSWMSLINIVGLLIIIVLAAISIILFATPIKNYLPGFESARIHRDVIEQGARMDSLTREIELAEQQLMNIKLVIAGEISVDSIPEADTSIVMRNKELKIDASEREKAFREEMEGKDKETKENKKAKKRKK